jgi:hypothetical protein
LGPFSVYGCRTSPSSGSALGFVMLGSGPMWLERGLLGPWGGHKLARLLVTQVSLGPR